MHAAFYLSNQTISIGVIGSGLIGGTFLDQLMTQMEILKKDFKIDLRIRGILNSRSMILSDPGRTLLDWRDHVKERALPADLEKFVAYVQADHFPNAVILECTLSAELTAQYPAWLERGIHIITPNKKANTGTMEFYRSLRSISRATGRHYLYETTVGAGLPIINTLRDMVQTGDHVLKIEGVLSGTLSYIFNTFDGTTPFSEIVREARAKGYTEPDPRETFPEWMSAASWSFSPGRWGSISSSTMSGLKASCPSRCGKARSKSFSNACRSMTRRWLTCSVERAIAARCCAMSG